MRKRLHVLRRERAQNNCYWEDFIYETKDEAATVATALRSLQKENRVNADPSVPFRPVAWEHSCLQKRCGACAMVINGAARLACDTPLSSLPGETVTLEPLRKFPVVEDLLVDRSVMMQELKELTVWLESEAGEGCEEMAFEASLCLQCGLCLEVCPNFAAGETFGGMAAMAPLSRLIAQLSKEDRKRIASAYERGVFSGCGKSLSCSRVCPAGIRTEEMLVRSNAAAVWKRWRSLRGRKKNRKKEAER